MQKKQFLFCIFVTFKLTFILGKEKKNLNEKTMKEKKQKRRKSDSEILTHQRKVLNKGKQKG